MPLNNVVLASTEFPSGVAWLKNALLALDIRIQPSHRPEYWVLKNGLYEIYSEEERATRSQWFPVLKSKNRFNFKESTTLHWTHEWPTKDKADFPTLLFTRHGKDSLYSDYRRNALTLTFQEYLQHPSPIGRGSLVALPYFPPAELWALYSKVWLERAKKNGLLVKFEEAKSNSIATLEKVLAFLEIERTRKEIIEAVESSTLQKAQSLEKSTPHSKTIHRKGQVNEWKESYNNSDHRYFDGFPAEVLSELGYDVGGSISEPMNLVPKDVVMNALQNWSSDIGEFSIEGKWASKPLLLLSMSLAAYRQGEKELSKQCIENVKLMRLTPIEEYNLGEVLRAIGSGAAARTHLIHSLVKIENPFLFEEGFRTFYKNYSFFDTTYVFIMRKSNNSIRLFLQAFKFLLFSKLAFGRK